MTNPIIERAAQALAVQDCLEQHGPDAGPASWQAYVGQVRAVLQAIREPSEAMLRAGVVAPNYLEDQSSRRGCGNIYTAMIDAALSNP